jgi:outer membrane protein OmpA-like peptidoglycan-associated protein
MNNRFLFVGLILVSIIVCSATQVPAASSRNPEQLVSQLEADLATARSNQVDVLSPRLFRDAQSAFIKAKQGLEKGAKLSAISDYVAEGKANLKKAEEIAQVSRTVLRETNKARDKALKVGADRLGEPYDKVENEYLKLTTAIERDNLSYAQGKAADVQAAFRDLEIMAIQNTAIGNARKMMTDAEKARVQKIAPSAYNDALLALNEADAYIGQNPYEADTISQKAAHAEFMARRMMTISENSQKFKAMTPEASALYLEGLLSRLGAPMNTGDLRDRGVEGQLSRLTGAVESMEQQAKSLEKENQNYQAREASLEQQFGRLKGYSREQEAARQKLAAEGEFNQQFSTVQRYFRPDEADVYKQGSQLVIRMRGIKFPAGQVTLTPENYILLSKVQQAIQTFGQPTVTIEGHTDTTEGAGSAQSNLALSQKRAEVVKTYLVANKTLPANRIRATGYGPDRPLAPNTTADGRATNRRIDVLITPVNAQ